MKRANLLREVRVLREPQVLLAMLMSTLASASLFTVFTYITPLLERVTGIAPQWVTAVLLLFGVGLTIGNIAGGRLADWKLMPSVIVAFVAVIAVLAAFVFTSHAEFGAIATVFTWGIVVFALVPLLQLRVVDTAADAPNLASTLNQGAFNLGNATGAWLGGVAITVGVGYAELPALGALIALAALGLAVVSVALQRSASDTQQNRAAA